MALMFEMNRETGTTLGLVTHDRSIAAARARAATRPSNSSGSITFSSALRWPSSWKL